MLFKDIWKFEDIRGQGRTDNFNLYIFFIWCMSLFKEKYTKLSFYLLFQDRGSLPGWLCPLPVPDHLHYSLLQDTFQSREPQTFLVCNSSLSRFTTVSSSWFFSVLFCLFQESHPLPSLKVGADQEFNFISFHSTRLLRHCVQPTAPQDHKGPAT